LGQAAKMGMGGKKLGGARASAGGFPKISAKGGPLIGKVHLGRTG